MRSSSTKAAASDPSRAARAYREAGKMAAVGAIVVLFFLAWAALAWTDIARLERGEIDALRIWGPVAQMYRLGGRWAAMAPYALFVLLGATMAVGGLRRARGLSPHVTRDALRQADRAEQQARHPFLRDLDESGAVPRRTIILGLTLVLLLAGTAAWVISQR